MQPWKFVEVLLCSLCMTYSKYAFSSGGIAARRLAQRATRDVPRRYCQLSSTEANVVHTATCTCIYVFTSDPPVIPRTDHKCCRDFLILAFLRLSLFLRWAWQGCHSESRKYFLRWTWDKNLIDGASRRQSTGFSMGGGWTAKRWVACTRRRRYGTSTWRRRRASECCVEACAVWRTNRGAARRRS